MTLTRSDRILIKIVDAISYICLGSLIGLIIAGITGGLLFLVKSLPGG